MGHVCLEIHLLQRTGEQQDEGAPHGGLDHSWYLGARSVEIVKTRPEYRFEHTCPPSEPDDGISWMLRNGVQICNRTVFPDEPAQSRLIFIFASEHAIYSNHLTSLSDIPWPSILEKYHAISCQSIEAMIAVWPEKVPEVGERMVILRLEMSTAVLDQQTKTYFSFSVRTGVERDQTYH